MKIMIDTENKKIVYRVPEITVERMEGVTHSKDLAIEIIEKYARSRVRSKLHGQEMAPLKKLLDWSLDNQEEKNDAD